MPFQKPAFRYDDRHTQQQGANAPDCLIIIHLDCLAGDCATNDMKVAVIEDATGRVLAAGTVRCTGTEEEHRLQMTEKRPLAVTRVITRFTCGVEQRDGNPRNIWCVCA
jgi:hypothetical protein